MSDIYRALADPTRRIILDELSKREGQTLFELCGRLAMAHDITSSRQGRIAAPRGTGGSGVGSHRAGRQDQAALVRRLPADRDRYPLADSQRNRIMRIYATSVMVDDQRKALRFYTEVLGFQKKKDVPVGDFAWLTVVSSEEPDGVELLLEPAEHPAAKPFRDALVADGIRGPRSPWTTSMRSTRSCWRKAFASSNLPSTTAPS